MVLDKKKICIERPETHESRQANWRNILLWILNVILHFGIRDVESCVMTASTVFGMDASTKVFTNRGVSACSSSFLETSAFLRIREGPLFMRPNDDMCTLIERVKKIHARSNFSNFLFYCGLQCFPFDALRATLSSVTNIKNMHLVPVEEKVGTMCWKVFK